jgi:hypothetical protein
LVEALKARGITTKTAVDLVKTHLGSRIQTKIEVFDWLLKNEDKRVGKRRDEVLPRKLQPSL